MGFKGRKQRILIEYNFRGSINSIRFSEYMVEGVGLKNIEWGGTASLKKKNPCSVEEMNIVGLHVQRVKTMIKFENTAFRMLVTLTIT